MNFVTLKKKTHSIKNMAAAFVFSASMIFSPTVTIAQTYSIIADSPCDTKYYESLTARAWLEAQREVSQNQNLILKPDSVFEYTCFDRMLHELVDHSDEMLSGSSVYSSTINSSSMRNALNNLVLRSLISYIDANFEEADFFGTNTSYDLLGGHPAAAGASLDHVPELIGSGTGAYSCDIMYRIWNKAKCMDFISNSTTDGFYTFGEYHSKALTGTDVRHLPEMCSPVLLNWEANINTGITSGPWTNDPVDTYFEKIQPQTCASGDSKCKCSGAPIPTGLTVQRTGFDVNTYEEKICLQPGCRYHPGGVLYSGSGNVSAGCYAR